MPMVGIVSASVTILRQRGRHHLQHDQAGTGGFQRARVGDQLRGGGILASLHPVAAELVDRLRQQAEMRAHRNAALGEEGDGLDHHRAAFQLDHVRARRHQPRSGGKRALGRGLVAAEGQVGDDEGAFGARGHAARVVRHLGELHRQGRGVALHHHAERVADQQHVDAGGIEHAREAGVVAGEHGDFFAAFAHGLEGGQGDGHAHAARLKNSRGPRILLMRSSSSSKSASLCAKLRLFAVDDEQRRGFVAMEKFAVAVGQALQVVGIHAALELHAAPLDALLQRVDRRLQVDHQVGRRRLRGEVGVDLLVQLEFVVVQIQAREQHVLVDQEIRHRAGAEQVALRQVAQLARALEQEMQLRRQRVASAVPGRSAAGRDCRSAFSSRVSAFRRSASLWVRLVLPTPIGPSTTM